MKLIWCLQRKKSGESKLSKKKTKKSSKTGGSKLYLLLLLIVISSALYFLLGSNEAIEVKTGMVSEEIKPEDKEDLEAILKEVNPEW